VTITVVPMRAAHGAAVQRIYQAGLDEGDASFESAAPAWPEFDASHRPDLRFVAVRGRMVTGWVACSPVSTRAAYSGVVEHSVYVDPAGRRSGVGRALLIALLNATTSSNVWTVQSSLFPENQASLVLHDRLGFRVVGRRDRIGRHAGRWRDTLLVEWRNPVIQ
jgi:phosphinothricin acetyltransferase